MVWQRQLLAYHPVLGWWFVPGLKSMIVYEGDPPHTPYLLRTNSIGMRSDREYSLKTSSGRRRIVLLGDSYTAGQTVANSDRFSDLLEKSHPNLDVMNFGLPGTGTDQQLLIYETLAKAYEADAYIFAPFWGNIIRNQLDLSLFGQQENDGHWRIWGRPKPYFTLDEDRLVLHNQPVPNESISEQEAMKRVEELQRRSRRLVMRPTSRWLYNVAFLTKHIPYEYSDYESENSQSWRLMRAIIERFIRQVNGKPVFIVPLPDSCHYILGLPATYLARYAKLHNRTNNRFLLDVLPHFNLLSHEDRKRCRYLRDPHYSPRGHKAVADAISDGLAEYCPDLLS